MKFVKVSDNSILNLDTVMFIQPNGDNRIEIRCTDGNYYYLDCKYKDIIKLIENRRKVLL